VIISASGGTVLSEYTAIQRIRAIIDGDPRIKSEIEQKIRAIEAAILQKPAGRQGSMRYKITEKEMETEIEKKKREWAIYAQYIEDAVFAGRVDNALAA
jgi:hypothetical protein